MNTVYILIYVASLAKLPPICHSM